MSTRRLVRAGPAIALPVHGRAATIGLITALVLLALAVATLTLGRLGVPLVDLPPALTGDSSGKTRFVLDRLRGPRLIVAIAAGAAFGLSGTLFQSSTRNPLASPDIIGVTAGAGAGAAVAALWLTWLPIGLGALAGATVAAGVVYLSTGTGFGSPSRIILAGIGVAAMAVAFIQYVVLITSQDRSLALAGYLAGTLSARTWTQAITIGAALAVLLPAAMALGPRLRMMELGDHLSDSLGAKATTTRGAAILIGVALCAAAVATAGPIVFVALTAPQIARRLTGGSAGNLIVSAFTGAVLLVAADLIVQQTPALSDLPVGIITGGLGGTYLGVLLVREWRKGTL